MSLTDDKRTRGNKLLRFWDEKGVRHALTFTSLEKAEDYLLEHAGPRSIADLRRVSVAGIARWYHKQEESRGLLPGSLASVRLATRKLTRLHGATPISEVRSSDVLAILQQLVDQSHSPSYIKHTARHLTAMFNQALLRGCITSNPAEGILEAFNLGKAKRPRAAQSFDDRHLHKIRMACRPIELAAVDMLSEIAATGVEAAGVEWARHINFREGTIFLPLPDLPATKHTEALTGRGRTVPMTDRLIASLLRHWLTRPNKASPKVFAVFHEAVTQDAFAALVARPQVRCGLLAARVRQHRPDTRPSSIASAKHKVPLVRYGVRDFTDRGAIKIIKARLGKDGRTNLLDVADELGFTTTSGVTNRFGSYASHGDEFPYLEAVDEVLDVLDR